MRLPWGSWRSAATVVLTGLLVVACDQSDMPSQDGAALADLPGPEFVHDAEIRARLSADSLAAWHDRMASEPHQAGTPGDLKLAVDMARAFEDMGLDVELHPFWAYLPFPVSGSLEITAPEVLELPVAEEPADGDPYTLTASQHIGWNGYAGSGEVEADVVYVNYGRKEDYEALVEAGFDLAGKIHIARYGGNFRGYKAKFAAANGAVGLIIYSDPADAGYGRGLMYPEGGYFNSSTIQRGSILTLPYSGDPLTPFHEATEDAERLDPADVAMPNIPVQPIGWGAAQEILSRMSGAEIPDDTWQGGLPFRYRVTSGGDFRLRLRVEQERRIAKSYNVVATLEGSEEPDRTVMIGAHHDAWLYGAADPTAGSIVVMELARVFSELAQEGARPRRSIAFALWGAEEMGLIGSVEWVEANLEAVRDGMVAYINLDSAAIGPRFAVAASPSLHAVYEAAAERSPWSSPEGERLADVWDNWQTFSPAAGEAPQPQRFGDLGGGSDHVGFIAQGGVPSSFVIGRGGKGTAYHSISDNLAWYRHVIGADYASAQMIAALVGSVTDSLASSPALPLRPDDYVADVKRHLEVLAASEKAKTFLTYDSDGALPRELRPILAAAEEFESAWHKRVGVLLDDNLLDADETARLNTALLAIERHWLSDNALPNRPWFQSLYAATDEDAGYAPWMLPPLQYAVAHQDRAQLERSTALYEGAFRAMADELEPN